MLARRVYARYRGYEFVTEESDWRRPRSGGQNWVSKVDFELIARFDPSFNLKDRSFEYDTAEDEVRAERMAEAQLQSLADRLAQRRVNLDFENS